MILNLLRVTNQDIDDTLYWRAKLKLAQRVACCNRKESTFRFTCKSIYIIYIFLYTSNHLRNVKTIKKRLLKKRSLFEMLFSLLLLQRFFFKSAPLNIFIKFYLHAKNRISNCKHLSHSLVIVLTCKKHYLSFYKLLKTWITIRSVIYFILLRNDVV